MNVGYAPKCHLWPFFAHATFTKSTSTTAKPVDVETTKALYCTGMMVVLCENRMKPNILVYLMKLTRIKPVQKLVCNPSLFLPVSRTLYIFPYHSHFHPERCGIFSRKKIWNLNAHTNAYVALQTVILFGVNQSKYCNWISPTSAYGYGVDVAMFQVIQCAIFAEYRSRQGTVWGRKRTV